MKLFFYSLFIIISFLNKFICAQSTEFTMLKDSHIFKNTALFLRQIQNTDKFCAAAVISEFWLITSPYCFTKDDKVLARINTVQRGFEEKKHKLASIRYFPNSTHIETINDGICLIAVKGIIELFDPQSQIFIAHEPPLIEDVITITEIQKERDIRIYNTSMINTTLCAKHFEGSGFTITENMFCVTRNQKYDCQDESYRVATIKGTLVGILSALSRNCSSGNFPDVYINVVKYNNENVASIYNDIKYPASKVYVVKGGDTTSISKAPYQAQIRRNGVFFCGATIISNNWLISAAHCFTGPISGVEIITGSEYTVGGNGAKHVIHRLIVHPHFDRKTLNNDICLIRILKPLRANPFQVPIWITRSTPRAGDKIIITGFGQKGVNLPSPPLLQKATIPVVDRAECIARYASTSFQITDSMFCAGRGPKAACPGDSGGPAVIGRTLVGIVTGGYGCSSSNFPGVYTRIDRFRSWILQHTGIYS